MVSGFVVRATVSSRLLSLRSSDWSYERRRDVSSDQGEKINSLTKYFLSKKSRVKDYEELESNETLTR